MKSNLPKLAEGNACGCERAFTFLELLVVIATLAILAALVLPALAQSGDNDARMVCMNNLRQMGAASSMYVTDNRDYLPYPNWDGGSATAPRGWLYSVNPAYLPPGAPAGAIPNPIDVVYWKNNPTNAWRTGLWFQYVQNPKAFLCPVDIESRTYTTPAPSGGRQNKLSTYVMNGAVTGYPGGGFGTPCKITDVWSPACYLLWEPDENANSTGNPGALEYKDGANFPNTSEGIGRLHSANSGNMLCVGGNAELVTVQAFKKQSIIGSGSGPGGKTLAWWFPGVSNGN